MLRTRPVIAGRGRRGVSHDSLLSASVPYRDSRDTAINHRADAGDVDQLPAVLELTSFKRRFQIRPAEDRIFMRSPKSGEQQSPTQPCAGVQGKWQCI